MRDSETKEFDGQRFHMRQLSAMKAARTSARVGRLLTPAIARLAGGRKLDDQVDPAAFSAALGELFDRLTPDEMEGLIRDLLAATDVESNGKMVPLLPVFDAVMQGRLATLFLLLRWSIDMNGFFAVAGGLLGGLGMSAPAGAAESKSPTT